MNGRQSKARRRAAGPIPPPDYPVTRTRPLEHVDARGRSTFIGHASDAAVKGDARVVLTPSGRQSFPDRMAENGVEVVPSKSHRNRVQAARRRGLVGWVRDTVRVPR